MKQLIESKLMEERIKEYQNTVYKTSFYWHKENGYEKIPSVRTEKGRRYAKVFVGDRVHTFVDMNNGDILKAASYKAPAKNGVRGSIFSNDFGASVINWYGAKYIK